MRIPVNAPKASKVSGPYSQGDVAEEFVFVSGQDPLDEGTGEIIRTSIKEQSDLTLQNIKHIVEAVGSSKNDVVKVKVYLSDMADFDRFNEVYKRYFTGPTLARSCVQSGLDGIKVEIDAVAWITGNKQRGAVTCAGLKIRSS